MNLKHGSQPVIIFHKFQVNVQLSVDDGFHMLWDALLAKARPQGYLCLHHNEPQMVFLRSGNINRGWDINLVLSS